jgi:transposase-like protein
VRNGTRPKTVLTEGSGQVGIEVPRDRDGSFEPQIVKKRQRRLSGVDEMVLSLYAKGLTTGEISAHFAEIYGASVSKETISRITDKVLEEMADWCNRPLDGVYAAVFIDAVMVKVRVLSLIVWVGQWARRTRFRSSSRLARPNIWRLSILSRLMLPSTGPEL